MCVCMCMCVDIIDERGRGVDERGVLQNTFSRSYVFGCCFQLLFRIQKLEGVREEGERGKQDRLTHTLKK